MLMWIIWVHSVIKKCAKFRDPLINFSWVLFRFKFEHGRYADGLRGPSSASFGRYEVGSAIAALRPRAHDPTWV